jgi:DNA-binding response OmpR family regulator
MVSSAEIHDARLLVVDDRASDILLLSSILGVEGYRSVDVTLDPVTVCELHRKNRYDLILLDLNMPGMNGFEVMEELKGIEESTDLPVMVITTQPDHWIRALGAGARDFMCKPFRIPELLAHVHCLLESCLTAKSPRRALVGPGGPWWADAEVIPAPATLRSGCIRGTNKTDGGAR